MNKFTHYIFIIFVAVFFSLTAFAVPVLTTFNSYIDVIDTKSEVITDTYYRNDNFSPIEVKDYYGNTKYINNYEDLYSSTNDGQKYITMPKDEEGYYNILVLPISFLDSTKGNLENRRINIHNAFFGARDKVTSYSVAEYYNISSYGNVKIRGEVAPYYELDLSSEEVIELSTKVNASKYVTTLAVENYFNNGGNLKDFDKDNNNYIDGLFIIYDYPYSDDNEDLFWAYVDRCNTNYKAKVKIDNTSKEVMINHIEPFFSLYGWASYDFMHKTDFSRVDAHVYIHEVGHLFGLEDYYSSSSIYQPLGCLDMMDFNIGDHNAFSKYLLDWVAPFVIKEATQITLKPFSTTGQFILLPSIYYHDNPFGEYLLLEFYTPEGVNNKDINFDFVYTNARGEQYNGKLFTNYGIKLYHVDARIGYFEKKNTNSFIGYVDDPNIETILAKHKEESTNKSWCYRFSKNNENSSDPLIKIIEKGESNNLKNGLPATNDTLFKQGDKFKIGNFSTYEFNNSHLNFGFEVVSISPTEAVINIVNV